MKRTLNLGIGAVLSLAMAAPVADALKELERLSKSLLKERRPSDHEHRTGDAASETRGAGRGHLPPKRTGPVGRGVPRLHVHRNGGPSEAAPSHYSGRVAVAGVSSSALPPLTKPLTPTRNHLI